MPVLYTLHTTKYAMDVYKYLIDSILISLVPGVSASSLNKYIIRAVAGQRGLAE